MQQRHSTAPYIHGNFIGVYEKTGAGPNIKMTNSSLTYNVGLIVSDNILQRWPDVGSPGTAIELYANGSYGIANSTIANNNLGGTSNTAGTGIYLHGSTAYVAWVDVTNNNIGFFGTGINLGANALYNSINEVSTLYVTTPIGDSNPSYNQHLRYRKDNNWNERWGTASFTGNGTNKDFTVTHNLPGTPAQVWVESASAANNSAHYIKSTTSTTFVVSFATAPANGSNVVFHWRARMD